MVRTLARAALATLGIAALPAGCSLGNVSHDACSTDVECATAFGVGSACHDGYCSDAGKCQTGHDCRKSFGGGACVGGECKLFVPKDDACDIVEPSDLFTRPLAGDGATLVIGAVFAKDDIKNQLTADSVRVAVREIAKNTGVASGQPIGVVVCDNGGPQNMASGDDRTKRDEHALDYLAGTLGVPFLVGPRTSSDALAIVAHLVDKKYPTVVISPSATTPALTGVPSRLDMNDPQPLFWRTCPSDALQGQVLATDLVGKDPAIASAAVVYTNDAYGQGLSQVFQKTFGNDKTTLVPFDASKLGDGASPDQVAAAVKKANPDAVVVVAVAAQDTVLILKALDKASLSGKKYFFTDGSKDATQLLDPMLSVGVKAMVFKAKGTAPATARDDATLKQFAASLDAEFPGTDPTQYSFLTHAYDATYLGAFGTVYAASKAKGPKYDGRDVAAGMAHLEAGMKIDVGPVAWPGAKQTLTSADQIDLVGISGDLDLDPKLGEGPSPIEVWVVSPDGKSFVTQSIYNPTGN